MSSIVRSGRRSSGPSCGLRRRGDRAHRVGRGARSEFEEASDFYMEQDWALLERFADEVRRMSRLTAENPRLWPEIESGIRRAILRDFPFSLIYTIEPDRVFVLALAHHSRAPAYWRDRVPR
ncbi:type II toxin-antitoxin system RelE/ParE family toxin [Nannocystaceae bacterium ST9]